MCRRSTRIAGRPKHLVFFQRRFHMVLCSFYSLIIIGFGLMQAISNSAGRWNSSLFSLEILTGQLTDSRSHTMSSVQVPPLFAFPLLLGRCSLEQNNATSHWLRMMKKNASPPDSCCASGGAFFASSLAYTVMFADKGRTHPQQTSTNFLPSRPWWSGRRFGTDRALLSCARATFGSRWNVADRICKVPKMHQFAPAERRSR